MRPSPMRATLESDLKRKLLDEDALKWSAELETRHTIIHGYDLTVGKLKEYPRFLASRESNEEVGLADMHYPSNCDNERYVVYHFRWTFHLWFT